MTAPQRRNGILVSTIVRGCESKLRFADELTARAAGQHDGEKYQTRMFVYQCHICRGWHLTRKPQRKPGMAADFVFPPTPR
jgi:hypothetical protein